MSVYDFAFNRAVFLAEQRAAFFRPESFTLITGLTDGYDPPRKVPFWTRCMRGVIEAERDRRKYL